VLGRLIALMADQSQCGVRWPMALPRRGHAGLC